MSGLGRRGEGRTPGEARFFFEREAVNYATHYYESPDPVTRTLKQQRLDLLACLVRECVRPPARVLDVGCAEGHVEAVLPPDLDMVVLDLAVGRVATALVRIPALRGVAGDGAVLPFRDGAFDLVICSTTLDHLPDPFAGMRELARVVRPAGHVLVALDNRFKLFKRRIRVNEPTIDPNAHFNRLDYWKFRRLIRGTRLVPIHVAAFGFPFRTYERWVRRWPALKPWLDQVGARWPALSYEYHALLRKGP